MQTMRGLGTIVPSLDRIGRIAGPIAPIATPIRSIASLIASIATLIAAIADWIGRFSVERLRGAAGVGGLTKPDAHAGRGRAADSGTAHSMQQAGLATRSAGGRRAGVAMELVTRIGT
jgi:hypothetical protein